MSRAGSLWEGPNARDTRGTRRWVASLDDDSDLDFNGREADRTVTVASIAALKGSGSRYVQVTAGTVEEAAAAEAAGIDMVVCLAASVPEVRRGSSRLFVTAAIDFGGEVTLDDLLATAFRSLSVGADAVITARAASTVRLLGRRCACRPSRVRAETVQPARRCVRWDATRRRCPVAPVPRTRGTRSIRRRVRADPGARCWRRSLPARAWPPSRSDRARRRRRVPVPVGCVW